MESANRDVAGPPDARAWTDLGAAYEWFGARFAVLEAPNLDVQYELHRSSTTTSTHAHPDNPHHETTLTVRHRAQQVLADVSTTGASSVEASLADHMRHTLVNFQLARSTDMTHAERMEHMQAGGLLDLRLTPETTDTYPVTVDGEPQDWMYVTDASIDTGEPLIACGARVHDTLIAVASVKTFLQLAAVRLWSPPLPA